MLTGRNIWMSHCGGGGGGGIKMWRLFSDQYDHVDGRRAFLFAANAKLLNVLVQQKWMK